MSQSKLTDTISERRFCVFKVSGDFVSFDSEHDFSQTIRDNLVECSVINTFDDESFLYTFKDGSLMVGQYRKVYEAVS